MIDVEQYTVQNIPSQLQEHKPGHEICVPAAKARESSAMAPRDMTAGERLDQVLAAHGLNRARWAKKIGMTPGAVQKYKDALDRGDITASAWHSCARHLIAVGIDPNEVRPGAPLPTRSRLSELLPQLMQVTDRGLLTLMLELITVEKEDDRTAFAVYIRTVLDKK